MIKKLFLLFYISLPSQAEVNAETRPSANPKVTGVIIDVGIEDLILWQEDILKLIIPKPIKLDFIQVSSFPRLNATLSNKENHCGLGSNAPTEMSKRVMIGKAVVGDFFLFKRVNDDDNPSPDTPVVAMRSKAISEQLKKLNMPFVQVETRKDVAKLLNIRRFNYWVENTMLFDRMRAKYNLPEFKQIRFLGRIENWLVCSRESSPEVIKSVSDNWRAYKFSEELKNIYKKYNFYQTFPN